MARNTKPRQLVWVKMPAPVADIKYGFNSGADAGDRGILGQTPVTSDGLTGLVIGANNIKPGKATKTKPTGTESSFYAHDKRQELRSAGWTLTSPKIRTKRASKRSDLLYVTINGVKYGWSSAKATTQPADSAKLGIKAVKSTDVDVIYGCSFPKPPRAKTQIGNGSSYSIFVDPSKADALPDGWALVGNGKTVLAS